jgi:hypothetical protein
MVELQRPIGFVLVGRFALVGDIALVSYCPLPASYTLVCVYVYIEVNARIQEVHGEYIGKYSG